MFTIFIFLALVVPTTCKTFLQQVGTQAEAEASLMAQFASTFRPGAAKDHILKLEVALRPLYTAVPQEADGTLHEGVVRYVLHRFFAQRGWLIRGLEPGTGAQNSSSGGDSLQVLQEWVPKFLQNFLEQVAGGRGISLRELAILAAALEDLVHKETVNRLEKTFHALQLPLSALLDEEQIAEVLDVFMMLYLANGDALALGEFPNLADVQNARHYFIENVPDWDEVQQWTHSSRQNVQPSTSSLDFNAMSSIVLEIGATYESYYRKECASLKEELLDIESEKAGRVRLADFYKKGLSGDLAAEKVEYLRFLGALDETDPKQPHVIVSNYIGSRPNCVEVSQFYVVCCSHECEELMGKLENSIASEMAAPEQILPLVSALASDTVAAPRTLSAALTRRLHSIAESNAGLVPLHGRLFAQWMHHAFPRECPFPHKHSSTTPQTPDEWMQKPGPESAEASEASEEEMKVHIDRDTDIKPMGIEARNHHDFEENALPWSEEEELLNWQGGSGWRQPRSPWSMCTRGAMFAAAVLCSLRALRNTVDAKLLAASKGDEKFFV